MGAKGAAPEVPGKDSSGDGFDEGREIVPDAILIVADREHLKDLTARCAALGGGWLQGPEAFQRDARVKFVVMVAHDPERIRNGTPLVWVAGNDGGLTMAIIGACSKINGLTANKLLIGAKARAIVDPVIFGATATKGSA